MHSWQNGTRCRDGVKLLWCHSHLVWLVFEGSIPTCTCFHSENFFVTFTYNYTHLHGIKCEKESVFPFPREDQKDSLNGAPDSIHCPPLPV